MVFKVTNNRLCIGSVAGSKNGKLEGFIHSANKTLDQTKAILRIPISIITLQKLLSPA
jgi:hypothetical protein